MLSELRQFILAAPSVSTLIGERMYPTLLPQAPLLPAVTYQVISGSTLQTMLHSDNLPSARVQIDAWAERLQDALAVAEAIRKLFHRYEPQAMGGVHVAAVFKDNWRTIYEDEPGLHRVSRDFIVFHAESV